MQVESFRAASSAGFSFLDTEELPRSRLPAWADVRSLSAIPNPQLSVTEHNVEDHIVPTSVTCQATHFPCGNSTTCIPRELHCNGQEDCENGADERGCREYIRAIYFPLEILSLFNSGRLALPFSIRLHCKYIREGFGCPTAAPRVGVAIYSFSRIFTRNIRRSSRRRDAYEVPLRDALWGRGAPG